MRVESGMDWAEFDAQGKAVRCSRDGCTGDTQLPGCNKCAVWLSSPSCLARMLHPQFVQQRRNSGNERREKPLEITMIYQAGEPQGCKGNPWAITSWGRQNDGSIRCGECRLGQSNHRCSLHLLVQGRAVMKDCVEEELTEEEKLASVNTAGEIRREHEKTLPKVPWRMELEQ